MARSKAASALWMGHRETSRPIRWTASATSRQNVVELGPTVRRRAAFVLLAGAVGLVPWTIGLAVTLPRRYLVGTWTITWTGFDVVLIGCFSVTAWALWKQRQVAVPATMVSSVLLLCDAWFDLLTAHRGGDLLISTMTALFGEIPLAIGLAAMSTRLLRAGMRMSANTQDPGPPRSLWRAPLCQHEGMGR
jgi:hypothetical protein